MSEEEKKYWAWFLSVEGIGKKKFSKILKFTKQTKIDLDQIYHRPAILLASNIITPHKLEMIEKFKNQFSLDLYWDYLNKMKINVICIEDEIYPLLLKQIDDPPLVLFCKGVNLFQSELIGRSIAVVGTRRITSYGQLVTKKVVSELVGEQMMIISGGMYGVDMLAHQTALENSGQTIAVLGYGFDHCYPASARKFFEKFLQSGGMMISEFAPFTIPVAGNFPTRNRIVAGLSLGVLVTEAGQKSGSHITAQMAIDNNRSVYSIPGPITNPYSDGTKWLINQGALLVSSGKEIISDLQFNLLSKEKKLMPVGQNAIQNQILNILSSQAQTTDLLALDLGLEPAILAVELSMMELDGLIKKMGENWQLC